MPPIRVGIIGLSQHSWAARAHLPYLTISPDYQIVALCNSSTQQAKAARKCFNLPGETRIYGDPADLAKDPSVDLVICSVRVDKHFAAIAPALLAGKSVLVEWPLARNLSEAEELVRLKNQYATPPTKENGRLAVVNLQGRQAPFLHQVKQLLAEGRIGRVLSSSFIGHTGGGAGDGVITIDEEHEYFTRKEVGGNMVSIHFGHSIDSVMQGKLFLLHVFAMSLATNRLAYSFLSPPKTILANRQQAVRLISRTSGAIISSTYPKDTEDTISLHGTLASGVPLSYTMRAGPAFKDTPGLDWRIYGSKGEIRITAPTPFMQMGYDGTKIEVYGFASDRVEEVAVGKGEFEDLLPSAARNVAIVYRELAQNRESCTFEEALELHKLIDGMYRENDEGARNVKL
ncbi:uncharacterized protein A1O5_06847 [Cladophialophora psammophila CBS 110553]|uniref:Uncharacterized protein n=1 Tax=Cladophialophora psammophila CBS 110553 TaxID=1182543 RepID=W9WYN4_9EURO|nr:uncharacterized protein A1O5_06847 [Cladophialophora psammophila CBS 110553]EXJ69776.1 hypothetical protein A1O5_06847 [Cladophialophora psammophila CBS 110553]